MYISTKNINLFPLLLLLLLSVNAFAQVPPVQWNRKSVSSGLPSNLTRHSIIENAAGEFITVSAAGGVQRYNSVGYFQQQYDQVNKTIMKVIEATDIGYIMIGTVTNGSNSDAYIAKLDANFSIVWEDTLGGTAADGFRNIEACPDGGYILTGSTSSDDGTLSSVNSDTVETNYYVWVVKMDVNGSIEWQKTYGGQISTSTPANTWWVAFVGYQWGVSIIPVSGNKYFLTGVTMCDNGDVSFLWGDSDYWALQLDSVGNIIWEKTYGGSGAEVPSCGVETTDGNYVITGETHSTDGLITNAYPGGKEDIWVVKIDAVNGDTLWTKIIGGTEEDNNANASTFNTMVPTPDNGVILTASTRSSDGDIPTMSQTFKGGFTDRWVVKLDASGNIDWHRVLGGSNNEGGHSILLQDDGGVVVAGNSNSHNNGDVTNSQFGTGPWLLKLASCPKNTEITATTCANEPYDFFGTPLSTSGTYTNNSFQTSYGCDSLITLQLDVFPVPVTPLTASICDGDSYVFGTQTLTVSGVYNDTLTTASTGCDSIVQLTLSVNTTPVTSLAASICDGDSYVFGTQTLTVSGVYNDTLTTASTGCDSIVQLTLTVNVPAVPVISQTNSVLSTGNYSTYQWYYNGNAVSGETDQSYTINQNGAYYVVVTDANGCSDSSAVYNVINIGLTENAVFEGLSIYPNPVSDVVNIVFPHPGTFRLTDIRGGEIQSGELSASGSTALEMSGMAGGVYLLTITTSNNQTSVREIVKDQ